MTYLDDAFATPTRNVRGAGQPLPIDGGRASDHELAGQAPGERATTLFTRDRPQERHARRESHGKTIKLGSEHDPPETRGAILEGTIIPAGQPWGKNGRPGRVWTLIGLAVAWHVLRDRRMYVAPVVAGITLAAVAKVSREEIIPDLMRPLKWYFAPVRPRQKSTLPAR